MRTWIPALFIMSLIAVALGCSHSRSDPTAPPFDILTPPRAETTEGHVLWGAWDCTVDPNSLLVAIEPMRGIENHFDVTGFVMPPSCPDCISMQVLDVDLPAGLFSIKVMLRNPRGLDGHDVRGIVFLKGSQELPSADNYTQLFDLPGDYLRNPFQAFAKEEPNRVFGGGETHGAVYRIVLPPGNMAVRFAVDASWPDNCPEPYLMDVVKPIDFLDDLGSYSETIELAVYDWQDDIAAVQLDLSTLGAPAPVNLTRLGDTWQASITNTYGASPGFYNCWLQAYSAVGPVLYQPLEIEVKGFGPDRLPEVLGLMHKWVGGNPGEPLTKENMRYEGSDLLNIFNDTPYTSARLPYYDSIHRAPLTTVPYCVNLLNTLESQTDPPVLYNILATGAQQLGESFSPTPFNYNPTASPVADAMEHLYTAIGSSLSPGDKDTIASQTASLPWDLQYITGAVLEAVAEGYQYRQNAILAYSSTERDMLFDNGKGLLNGESTFFFVIEESADFDYPNMYRAAGPVLQALDQVRAACLSYVPTASGAWDWTTPIGRVAVGSSGVDNHGSGEYLLLLDPGGDDVYDCPAGANISLDNPFSICIDLSGNDTYQDQDPGKSPGQVGDHFAQGAGRMGIGILWDVYGDDEYDHHRFCQGMGNFGVGFLVDSGGNDNYNADICGQGSGYYGIGVLIDEWGNDRYDCYKYSQGFGYVKGWGFANDHEGNDEWIANDTNIIYPSPQTTDHNVSMSQGQGFGLRIDGVNPPIDRYWMSGGQGVLFDHSGDDNYSCGVFGQACAYWFGTGILADYGGTDEMEGIWYVQSATAHYGTSFLANKGLESDTYNCSMNVSQGGGHDFSNSFFLEEGGDDVYTSPGISLGGGYECGTGIFVDYAGNDTYHNTRSNSMGHGQFSDGRNRGSWGVFLDLGGTEFYEPGKDGPAENTTWTLGDIGAGGDYASGIVIWQ